jgi:hypothetical protein
MPQPEKAPAFGRGEHVMSSHSGRRQLQRLDSGFSCPGRQRLAGVVVVEQDVKTAQRWWQPESGEVGCGEASANGSPGITP